MKYNIQSVGFDADKDLLELVSKKLARFDKFSEHIIDVEVFMRVETKAHNINDKSIEIKCNVKGNTLFAKDSQKTFEEAIDVVTDVMARQLRKYKEKILN